MIKIGLQFFGGRGGGGSGGSRGAGRGGGGGSQSATESVQQRTVTSKVQQTSGVAWDTNHTARQDFFDAGNFKDLTATDFSKNMDRVQAAPVGSTARIRYVDKTETYVRKTSDSRWTTDTGRTMTNNDVASAAYVTTGAKVRLNTMVKKKKG